MKILEPKEEFPEVSNAVADRVSEVALSFPLEEKVFPLRVNWEAALTMGIIPGASWAEQSL